MVVVNVPTIDERRRIPQKAIDQVVKQIAEKFKPENDFYLIHMRARIPNQRVTCVS